MDKDHLIDLIFDSFPYESKDSESNKNLCDFKNYLEKLNLDQLRTMSKEFILYKITSIITIKLFKE